MKRNILVIEDDVDHQQLIRMHLTRNGFSNVRVVASMVEGLEAANDLRPQVVIADSGVVGDEHEVLRERLRRSHPDCRVIAYSSSFDRSEWADEHLLKSDGVQALIDAVLRAG